MKKIITLALSLACGAALAQKSDNVGIGTTKPDPSAILDLNSTNKGLLLPRMSQDQRNAISNPAMGLMIFQTDQNVGTYVYDGTIWQPAARVGSTATVGAWDLQGSNIDATDFIGSKNNFSLKFKVNNQTAGLIDHIVGNTSIGHLTLTGLTSGQYNSAFGPTALRYNSAGSFNSALGVSALLNNTTGNNNTAVGAFALLSNGSGSFNSALGSSALYSNINGIQNAALGLNSLYANTTGSYNTGVGSYSLNENTVGEYNTGVGFGSLQKNTLGNYNTAIGPYANFKNTTGSYNLAIGYNALYNNITGSFNLGLGFNAGLNNTGSKNIFIGYEAGLNETGSDMLYISNSNSANPLIKGSLNATSPWVRVNVKAAPGSPTPTTTGYMAIGDFDTAPAGAGAGGLSLPSSFTGGAYRLYVQDGILTEKLKVALRNSGDWADYVFASDYKLMPLDEVELFINKYKHLPNVPSAEQMASDGLDVTATSAKLMEKIEELTLYIIDLKKEIEKLKIEK